jgi:hypothetical protein
MIFWENLRKTCQKGEKFRPDDPSNPDTEDKIQPHMFRFEKKNHLRNAGPFSEKTLKSVC